LGIIPCYGLFLGYKQLLNGFTTGIDQLSNRLKKRQVIM